MGLVSHWLSLTIILTSKTLLTFLFPRISLLTEFFPSNIPWNEKILSKSLFFDTTIILTNRILTSQTIKCHLWLGSFFIIPKAKNLYTRSVKQNFKSILKIFKILIFQLLLWKHSLTITWCAAQTKMSKQQ